MTSHELGDGFGVSDSQILKLILLRLLQVFFTLALIPARLIRTLSSSAHFLSMQSQSPNATYFHRSILTEDQEGDGTSCQVMP